MVFSAAMAMFSGSGPIWPRRKPGSLPSISPSRITSRPSCPKVPTRLRTRKLSVTVSSGVTSRTRTRPSGCSSFRERKLVRLSYPASEQRAASKANGKTLRPSIPTSASPSRRQSIVMTLRAAKAACSSSRRSRSCPTSSPPSRFFTRVRTEPKCRCFSPIARVSRRTGTTRRCFTVMADSILRSRHRFRRASRRGFRWAAFTPRRICAAAVSTARNGIWPERNCESKTSSTISSLLGNG